MARRSDMPYARYVNGRFRGTTDEIIQWAAYKWGFRPSVLRAVATVESWWHQSAVGDNGDSFGLFQVRRPYHCWDACRIARDSTAFNADYYGGILRAYFDGKMDWLNTVERGREYRPATSGAASGPGSRAAGGPIRRSSTSTRSASGCASGPGAIRAF